jgi:hypothetical protein
MREVHNRGCRFSGLGDCPLQETGEQNASKQKNILVLASWHSDENSIDRIRSLHLAFTPRRENVYAVADNSMHLGSCDSMLSPCIEDEEVEDSASKPLSKFIAKRTNETNGSFSFPGD